MQLCRLVIFIPLMTYPLRTFERGGYLIHTCNWRRISLNEEMTPDEVLQYILRQKNGVVLLDGYSGCGKTTILKELRETSSRPVYLFSYENVVDEILRAARAKETCEWLLLDISENNCVIGIEDVDYLRGKEATQACLAEMVCNAAEKHLIIMTGNDVWSKTPVLCRESDPDTFMMANAKI